MYMVCQLMIEVHVVCSHWNKPHKYLEKYKKNTSMTSFVPEKNYNPCQFDVGEML